LPLANLGRPVGARCRGVGRPRVSPYAALRRGGRAAVTTVLATIVGR
jgi:hypothetical protein